MIHIALVKESVSFLYYIYAKDLKVTADGSVLNDDEKKFTTWEICQEQSEDLVNASFTMILYIIVFKM